MKIEMGTAARLPGAWPIELGCDAIVDLIARLAAAADTGAPMPVGRRTRLTVRRVMAGFAMERDDRR